MSRLASAHLLLGLAEKQGARRCSYLVRMIKPNSITSHDWHVQPICQRSLRAARLSGAPWIEAQAFAGVSSNLLRAPISAFDYRPRRFCANFLNLSKFHLHVKLNLCFVSGIFLPCPAHHCGHFRERIQTSREEITTSSGGVALRKISNIDRRKMRSSR